MLRLALGSLGVFPAMDVMRRALPMVLSFLKMALVVYIPLVLVVGTYELKAMAAVTRACYDLVCRKHATPIV